MKNGKNRPVSFGITLTSGRRTRSRNSNRGRVMAMDCRQNVMPRNPEQMFLDEFDFPLRKMPQPDKPPFTPDMFICKPVLLPWKLFGKEARVRVHQGLKRFLFRTAPHRFRPRAAWHPAPEKSSPMSVAVPWEFFKTVFVGVFAVLKYTFIAVALIITIGCMMCAGRQTGGLR